MLMLLAIWAIAASCAFVVLARLIRASMQRQATGFLQRTESDLALLFIFVSAARLRLIAALVVALAFAMSWILGIPTALGATLAASMAFAPRLMVEILRRRWKHRLATQLPDAVALWAGLLRAGQAMAPALTQLASRQANPLGAELRLVLSQYRLGVGLDVAVAQFRDRAAVPDLRMLATLLRAQRDLGGNLAEPLERLSSTLRNRLAMEARIRSMTAQGRLQGLVVGVLPLLLAAVLAFMEPQAMKAMATTPPGWAAMSLVLILEVAGFTMIRRIVNIDV